MSKSELSPLLINEEPSGRAHVEEVVDFSQHVATSDDIGSSRQTEVLSRHYRSFNVTPIANEWSKLLKKKKPVRKKAKRVMREILDDDEGSLHLRFSRLRGRARSRNRSPSRDGSSSSSSTTTSSSTSMTTQEPQVKVEEEPHVIVARTALIIPFKYANPMDADVQSMLSKWTSRTLTTSTGQKLNLWRIKQNLPHELGDLDPRFREVLGMHQNVDDIESDLDDGEVSPSFPGILPKLEAEAERIRHPSSGKLDDATTAVDPLSTNCKRLEINPELLQSIFSNAKIVAAQSDGHTNQRLTYKVKIENIDIVAFPLGTAVLVFSINWLPETKPKMTLEEFKSWLHISRYQYKVPNLLEGWVFEEQVASSKQEMPAEQPTSDTSMKYTFTDTTRSSSAKFTSKQTRGLAERVAAAVYNNTPISLNAFGNWLVLESDADEEAEYINMLGKYSKRCYHHSCVVVDKRPSQDKITEFLFNMRKPPSDTRLFVPVNWEGLDTLLAPKPNRNMVVGLQGSLSLSWPAYPDIPLDSDFEVRKWPQRFMGIYLILAAHAYGEKSALLELSHLSGDSGNLLTRISDQPLSYVSATRTALVSLATLMTRFALKMSSDDCGGLPEYMEFFSAIRTGLGIKQHRKELREEIHDVLALIETNYAEERRKIKEQERLDREENERLQMKKEKEKERLKARYERFVTIVSSFALPIFVVTSLFSTSLNDMPQLPWWWVIGVTLGLSVIFLVLLIVLWRTPKSGSGRAKGIITKRQGMVFV